MKLNFQTTKSRQVDVLWKSWVWNPAKVG